MLAFRNVFKYRNSASNVITSTIFDTFCVLLVKICHTNPKDLAGSFCTFWDETEYHTKYLSKYWTKLHQLFSIDRHINADYKTEIILAVVKETLLW